MSCQRNSWADPVWPPTLRLSERPPKLIYLDLNHWIGLSKAHSGHRNGDNHKCALEACLEAVRHKRAIFPLSEFIYFEIGKMTNYRQRHDLREVIERISRYMVVTSLTVVAKHEIEAVLDLVIGPKPTPINTTNYLDWGVDRAFGRVADFRIKSDDGKDVTEEVRRQYRDGPEAFDKVLFDAQIKLNRKVIEGPAPLEEPKLIALGWNPKAGQKTISQLALDEHAQARRLDDYPNWRVGRIRDLITAREIIKEFGDILEEGLSARGPGAADQLFALRRDDLDSAFRSMPSLDVAVTLKTSLHRDPNHKWVKNDIHDIGALALTIPYCDVVVTDRAMWSHVSRNKLSTRYDSIVIPSLEELPNYL